MAGRTAIGVDIGGTHVRAARVTADGNLDGHVKVRTDSRPSVPRLVVDLCLQLRDDTVAAIGVGVPGRLAADRSAILSSGYADLGGIRLGDIVTQAVGRPTVLENDACMALLAELRLGVATKVDDVVLFTVGTGVGGAVAIGRTLRRGRGNAGQLGHIALDPTGPGCNCGSRGCAETLASGTALARLVAEAGWPPSTTAQGLLEQRGTDPVATAILSRWAAAWRGIIHTTVAMLDPELVVLGGGLGSAAVAALELSDAPGSPWFECPVMAAAFGDDAGVIGAGLRALEGDASGHRPAPV